MGGFQGLLSETLRVLYSLNLLYVLCMSILHLVVKKRIILLKLKFVQVFWLSRVQDKYKEIYEEKMIYVFSRNICL